MKLRLTGPRILAVFALSMSAVFFHQAYASYSQANDLIQHGKTVSAIITAVVHKRGKYPGTLYDASFTIAGKEYVASNKFITNDSRYQVGDTIHIIYDATNPAESIIDDSYERSTWLIYSLVGLIIFGVVVAVGIYSRTT